MNKLTAQDWSLIGIALFYILMVVISIILAV